MLGSNERRHRRRREGEPLAVLCRECWTPIELLPERVDLTNGRAHYRCQECQLLFIIRDADAEALGPPASLGAAVAENDRDGELRN